MAALETERNPNPQKGWDSKNPESAHNERQSLAVSCQVCCRTSPLLANIALDGIEDIHKSVRYADDMVFILKPKDNANKILAEIEKFLAQRGLKVKASKTKLASSTDGFDFLGWHFYVQKNNGKFRSVPSKENFKAFRKKVKKVVNNSNYGAKIKAMKLAPIVRGWRNYHRFCKLEGKYSLYHLANRAWHVFNREKNLDRYKVNALIDKAFPKVPYKENDYVNVKGDKSLFDGDVVYWSKRNSKLYNNLTAQALRVQDHKCGYCKLKLLEDEIVELHHIDGNHNNWKYNNLLAIHKSCHDYIHASKS
jgi:5-methylcytosine-specific restriction endonuclease McrA